MRKAQVFVHSRLAGEVWEDENGFHFGYLPEYLASSAAAAVSLTLPLTDASYHSDSILPFFDGLIPEGWLLEIAEDVWKINPRDRVGLLFACCGDCIGAVSIIPEEHEN
jgi:serine/threonine-protein kinase HipA